VSKHSTSGYLFPRLLFRSHGLDPDSMFSKTREAGRHIRALEMLIAGKCDGAAVYSMRFMNLKSKGKLKTPLKIVAATAPIPDDAVCASPKLDPKRQRRIQALLLEFDIQKHGSVSKMKADSTVTSFIKGKDARYDIVRKALAAEAQAQKSNTKKNKKSKKNKNHRKTEEP
jgi:ABC-type phosphate/phosphonate transport system substrate-binding protein